MAVLIERAQGLGVSPADNVLHARDPASGATFCGEGTFKMTRIPDRPGLPGERCRDCFPDRSVAADGGGTIEEAGESSFELSRDQAMALGIGILGLGIAVGAILA